MRHAHRPVRLYTLLAFQCVRERKLPMLYVALDLYTVLECVSFTGGCPLSSGSRG